MYFLAIMTSLAPLKYQNTCQSVYFICIYVVYYIKEMTLPILLIFYVSKWKNNKKHWKSEYDVTVTSSLGVASQNWVWGFFVQRWSLCVNFMTLALLVAEIQKGGPRSPPPSQVTDWQKKPSLNRVKLTWKKVTERPRKRCKSHFRE